MGQIPRSTERISSLLIDFTVRMLDLIVLMLVVDFMYCCSSVQFPKCGTDMFYSSCFHMMFSVIMYSYNNLFFWHFSRHFQT